MDFKIIYRDEALADLQQLTAWSWDRHPETTERFITALLNHIDLLAKFPAMGVPVKPEHPATPAYAFVRVLPNQ